MGDCQEMCACWLQFTLLSFKSIINGIIFKRGWQQNVFYDKYLKFFAGGKVSHEITQILEELRIILIILLP